MFFNPRFEQTFEEESGWLTLRSDELTYRVRGVQPKSAELVHRYRQFADWYARLNGIKPGNLPPFARLEVNRALAAKGLIPAEVERTRVHSGGLRTQKRVARSRHLHNWLLSSKDRDRIHQAGQFMARFTPVSVQEYFRVVADDEDSRK